MAYEIRELSGSLFKNGLREKDTQPNARGDCKIAGVIYEVSAWTKTDKNGNKWQSLAFKAKAEGQDSQEAKPAKSVEEMDSDIPF